MDESSVPHCCAGNAHTQLADCDWPAAAAVSIALLATLVLPIALYQRQQARLMGAGR